MITSWLMILIVLLVLAAVGCLLSARTRVVGLALLGIFAAGVLFNVMAVRSTTSPPRLVNIETYDLADNGALFEHQRMAAESQARAAAAQARAAAEVLKNQRLAARLPDGVLQISPDGSRLETYPDGMQIREDYTSRQRTLLRDADLDPAKRSFYTPYSSQSSVRKTFAFWLLGAPFAVLALAFVAVRAKKSGGGGWPAALAILGCVPLLFFFATVSQTQRTVHSGDDATVAEVPLTIRSAATTVRRSPKFVEDGRGVVIPIPQPVVPPAAGDREFARVFARELGEDGNLNKSAYGPSSMETLWDKLTRPRIELDSPEPASVSPTKAEVAQAAKIILAASAPVADPFTQGWLVNAAKAIVQAVPRADENRGEMEGDGSSALLVDEMAEALALQPKQQHVDRSAVSEYSVTHPLINLRLNKIEGPRPDWIDDPPQRVGNAQRITVSTDPFTTAEECRFQLQEKVEAVVEARLAELATQANSGTQVNVRLEWLGIEPEYLAEFCPQGEYEETISTSVGDMTRLHTLVEFTPPQERFLLDRWLHDARLQNLELVAGMSSLVVAGLALVFGLLKVDTWTRGYYTKRLFLGVPAAIIAVFFLSANIFGW